MSRALWIKYFILIILVGLVTTAEKIGAQVTWKTEKKSSLWTEADSLINEQKFQGALDQTLVILKKAQAAKDSRLQTEALLRATQLQIGLHGYETAVRFLQEQTWPNDDDGKILLHLFYGFSLMTYHNIYSWEIGQRERTVSNKTVDLKAWTREQIGQEISRSFDSAMTQTVGLDKPMPEFFSAYVDKNNYPLDTRPVLRDTLVYLAVNHLANTQYWTAKQNNEVALLPIQKLVASPSIKRIAAADDKTHPLEKISSWLGEHHEHHLKNQRQNAALEALYELYQKTNQSVSEAADQSQIQNALRQTQKKFKGARWWARGQALLAEMIQNENSPGKLIRAYEEASLGLSADPIGPGGKMCAAILNTIKLPAYTMTSMNNDQADKKSILITYKNINKMYFRIYPVDFNAFLLNSKNNEIFNYEMFRRNFNDQKPVFEWSENLSPTVDYAFHRKLVVPKIPATQTKNGGTFWIVASTQADFSARNNVVHGVPFIVTHLVITTLAQGRDGSVEVQIRNGETGEPVVGAEVELHRFQWSKNKEISEKKMTGADGLISFKEPSKKSNDYWNYFLIARKSGMIALKKDPIYFHPHSPEPKQNASFVYTDRAVYRPGQKILWKTVSYTGFREKGDFTTQKKGQSIQVSLVDPNSQVVLKKNVLTNDFGTTSGEFTIPTGRPLGAWRVMVSPSHGSSSIQVEEYKRPTFEIQLSEAKTSLRLNRKIVLSGEAKYYFGQPVSAGGVQWRITRQVQIPWWWYGMSFGRGSRWYFPQNQNPETVAQGKSILKPDGTFDVEFNPAADERKGENDSGVTYLFNLEANVTDEGGETRTASRIYRVGFVSVESTVQWKPGFFTTDEPVLISSRLQTLDGKPLAGQARYQIHRLIQPKSTSLPAEFPRQSLSVARDDEAADLTRYASPDDFKRARWESDFQWEKIVSDWKAGDQVAQGNLSHDTQGEAEIKIKAISQSGFYRIEYETKDKDGGVFKMARTFMVVASKADLRLPLLLAPEQSTYEVGQKAKFLVHSGLTNQPLLLEVYRAGERVLRKKLISNSSSSLFEYDVKPEDRGGFTIALSALRDHQFMRQEVSILVPWTEKKLDIEFATFRDRIRPSSSESFRITVKDSKGKKLAPGSAEILAEMYDRSLDLFKVHSFPDLMQIYPSKIGAIAPSLSIGPESAIYFHGDFPRDFDRTYLQGDRLKFHQNYGIGGPGRRGGKGHMEMLGSFGRGESVSEKSMNVAAMDSAPMESSRAKSESKVASALMGRAAPASAPPPPAGANAPAVEIRSNFSETAFFYPQLLLNKDGSNSIEFTVPDSVTSWKVFVHALTQNMRSGSAMRETQSVKDLMVRPYLPRFLREGDTAELKVTINNASAKEMTGQLSLSIEDLDSGKSAIEKFGLKAADAQKKWTVPKNGSTTLTFLVSTPKQVGMYALQAIAKSGQLSDGERRPFPVLPSRMHLAQSRFVSLKNKDRKVLEFKDLAENKDASLINEKMVVTVDTQLFYGVLQSLPYLIQYPFECAEQTLNRFLSTGIVTSVFKQFPAIDQMAKKFSARKEKLERFDEEDPNRRMTLEESPWLQQAQGGAKTDQDLINILDSRVALAERDRALSKLKKMQLPNGAFPWFQGGKPDEYMTVYILMGLGRAMEFQIDVPKDMVVKAWEYTRQWLDSEMNRMMSHECCWELITMINFTASHYPDASWTGGRFDEAYRKKLLDYSFRYWKKHSPLLKGYLALTLKRIGRDADAKLVWASVMDSAKSDDQLGTYWAAEDRSWLWYNDTIESHAFALRTLSEIEPNNKNLDGMVQWIFLNKKLNHWKSTRATSEVIYSLVHFLSKNGTLGAREVIDIAVGPQKTQFVFEPNEYTGKKNQIVIPGEKINSGTHSKIIAEKSTPGYAFTSATWHYSTDQLPKDDRGDFFSVSRKYFKRENNGKEWILKPLVENEKLKIGDQIEVQLSLKTKHEAEYVHLRDPRAAGLEPENVTSGHRWDLGISWYEETRDSGSNFFFSKLPVGEYTFKYRLRANMNGQFRIGPATVQSMYAPEFNAFSAGALMKIQ